MNGFLTISVLGQIHHHTDEHNILITSYLDNVGLFRDEVNVVSGDDRVALVEEIQRQHVLLSGILDELPRGRYHLTDEQKAIQSMSGFVRHQTPLYKRY